MLASDHRRRDSSLKRDIFAVLTFVATGFLFYLVQTHDPMSHAAEKADEVVEQLSDPLLEAPGGASLKEEGTRDS